MKHNKQQIFNYLHIWDTMLHQILIDVIGNYFQLIFKFKLHKNTKLD